MLKKVDVELEVGGREQFNKLIEEIAVAAGGRKKIHEIFVKYNNRYFEDSYIHKPIIQKLWAAHYLDLHKTKGKKIFDIGTGAGWWPFICRHYGHDCTGADFSGRPEYDAGYELLNIKVPEIMVYPYKKTPLPETYDYITAFRAFFSQRPKAWDKDEWKFFLEDMYQYLNDDGLLFLGTNSGSKTDVRFRNLPLDEKSHWGNKELGVWFKNYVLDETDPNKRYFGSTLIIPKAEILTLLNS